YGSITNVSLASHRRTHLQHSAPDASSADFGAGPFSRHIHLGFRTHMWIAVLKSMVGAFLVPLKCEN
ncbi:MAG: hypothetical protein Q4A92_10200, partial [Corynebacterium sp.]|nr:hypothetical protein [Corynebacterium sp.]